MRAESTVSRRASNQRTASWQIGASIVALAIAAISAPAFAQENPGEDESPAEAAAEPPVGNPGALNTQDRDIVVTGSRIVRRDYESNSPVVTVNEALFDQSSTAALESNLNKLPQFVPAQTPTAGADIQPTATNTPGAATVSLRGIGSNRNLVLVDGRRSTPSNASGVVDISTIPSAAIERVEVISGGASATYGADAVAGVTNFILKKNFQGLELDAQMGVTQRGDGLEWQVSGIMGADFDDGRGNVSLALSVNRRDSNLQVDRPWYQELLTSPDTAGNGFFSPAPGVILSPGNAVCVTRAAPGCAALPAGARTISELFPAANPALTTGGGYNLFANPDGTVYTGIGAFPQRGGAYRFNAAPLDGFPWKRTNIGTLAYNNTTLFLILPLTRYNAFARGNYEINDSIGVFGQAQFSKVNTFTRNEPGPITAGWDVFLPFGSGVYVGSQAQQPNGLVLGTGNPSSVILNGQFYDPDGSGPLGNTTYVDLTPGNLADNPNNPAFAALYASRLGCGAVGGTGGCTNNQAIGNFLPAELRAALAARVRPARPGEPGYITPTPGAPPPLQPLVSGANEPFQLTTLMPDDRETLTDVVTFNVTAGFEGSIPGSDWTWEVFGSHGESHTFARQTGTYGLERVQTVLNAPGFGAGFVQQGNAESGGFGASTGRCTSGVNFFAPPAGGFSNDCLEAMRADLKNRSKFTQTIWEANVQGSLFTLPAGEVGVALGASYREQDYEFINDTLTTQGRSFLDQALGIYPSGDAFGTIRTKEAYAEALVPILADIPFIQKLSLELGGRMSDYNTTGTSYTYKILGDWEVTDWMRFRGGFNRAERAPNIGELFLAAQQSFGINNRGDVCSRLNPNAFSANPALNPTNAGNVEAVCRALMNQAGPDAAVLYYGTPGAEVPQSPAGFGFAFPTLVGNPNLTPEKANTWTAGVVLSSPFDSPILNRLRLSVDFYDITIKDAIGAQTIGAVQQQCFDPAFNPLVSGAAGSATAAAAAAANQFCQLLPRNGTGQLGNVQITYANSGKVHLQGIDAQLDWAVPIGPGTFTLNSVFNYQIDFESSALFPQLPLVDYVATTGAGENGLNPNVFEYRIFTTIGYGIGGARLALQWQYYPSIEDGGEVITVGGTPNTAGYPDYNIFSLNGSYAVTGDVNLRFGVDNLFDKDPPLGAFNPNASNAAGQLRGGAFLTGVHDTNGRRFYMGLTAKF